MSTQEHHSTTKEVPAIRVHKINGQDCFEIDQIHQVIHERVARLIKDANPVVKQAQESREIVNQLLGGIGGDMEKFQADTKEHVQSLRATRYAVVTEIGAISSSLKDVRQFFMGPDYKEEIERLREFVDLCERLQALKNAGFLDAVADTMLKLYK